MAKILVADDNSNIQKMVGLALKDQGIDVVAVGNGEAAVRKISDIIPDLVLADVFMPVRNGYEVCQYVKQDPALAHIPVILLVGAFDPLDEQEAQRVGADGVLKKPFVPPDPLIAMVKAALQRAGVSYSSEKTGDVASKNGDRKGSDLLKPRPIPAAAPIVIPIPPPAPPVITPDSMEMDMDGLVEEVSLVSTVAPPVNMSGGAPLAFANLMDGNAAVEEDPGFLPTVHPELAQERDWRSVEEPNDVPEEEDEEEKPKHSWRRDTEDLEAPEGLPAAAPSWRQTAFEEGAAQSTANKDWDAPQSIPAIAEAAASPQTVSDISAFAPLGGVHQAAPHAPFSADAWSSAISAGAGEIAVAPASTAAQILTAEAPVEVSSDVHAETRPDASTNGIAAADHSAVHHQAFEHDAVATAIDRFAGSQDAVAELSQASPMATSAWEVQAQKASLLAATWDAPAAPESHSSSPAAELELGEARGFAKTVEAAETRELLAEPGEGVDAALPEREVAALPDSPVADLTAPESSVDQQPAVVESPASEAALGESAAAATEQLASSQDQESSSAPQYATEGPAVELHGSEADSTSATHSAYAVEPISEAAGALEQIQPADAHQFAADEPLTDSPEATPDVAAQQEPFATDTTPLESTQTVEQFAAVDHAQHADAAAHAPAEESPTLHAPEILAEAVHVAADAAGQSTTDDVVARVLATLSPEVMQAITRELLKPVVEAMVREELKKKE